MFGVDAADADTDRSNFAGLDAADADVTRANVAGVGFPKQMFWVGICSHVMASVMVSIGGDDHSAPLQFCLCHRRICVPKLSDEH